MNTAIVNIEMQTSDIPALKDFLKKFKTSSIKIEEKDPTKMSKEEFFSMIDSRRKRNFKKMSREERKTHLGV